MSLDSAEFHAAVSFVFRFWMFSKDVLLRIRRKVYDLVRQIPHCRVTSYGE